MSVGTQGHRLPSAREPWITRRTAAGVVLFVGVLVFFLTQTRLPATLRKLESAASPASARGESTFGSVLDPNAMPDGLAWLAYGINLWDANAVGMLFAVLIGAAAMVAVRPEARLRALLQRRGRVGAAVGSGLGLPLFMCSACSAPVSMGFYRAGAALETSLGVILGSALLNPVGLLAVATLLPLSLLLARLAFAAYAVLLLAPAVARWADRRASPAVAADAADALVAAAGGRAQAPPPAEPWGRALAATAGEWWDRSREMALRLAGPMLVASLAVGVLLDVAPPQQLSDALSAGPLAVVLAAAVGTLVQLPTLFEIPLVLGVLALGLDAGPAAALLVTAPSTGLVTLAVMRRDVGLGVPGLMLAGTFVGGSAVGLAVAAL